MSAPTEHREVWSRRLAIGLPGSCSSSSSSWSWRNGSGGILIAKDLREDYERLVEQAEALEAQPAAVPAPAAPADEALAERPEVTVNLVLDDLSIDADVDKIPAWARVTFNVTNNGALPHDASTDYGSRALLDPGERATFTVEAPGSGTLRVVCTVPGHEAGGVGLDLLIAGGESEAAAVDDAANSTAAEHASPDNAVAYEGDKPPLEPRDPRVPPAPDATVHDSSFHVVGSILDTVVKEGVELTRDNPGRRGSQAVDLAPAQGAYIEFELADDCLYPFVTHAFNHVGAGAIGLFNVGDGGPTPAAATDPVP